MDLNSGYFGWYVSLAMRTAAKKIPSCNEQKVRGAALPVPGTDDVVELEEMPTDADVVQKIRDYLRMCVSFYGREGSSLVRKEVHACKKGGGEKRVRACLVHCALLGIMQGGVHGRLILIFVPF